MNQFERQIMREAIRTHNFEIVAFALTQLQNKITHDDFGFLSTHAHRIARYSGSYRELEIPKGETLKGCVVERLKAFHHIINRIPSNTYTMQAISAILSDAALHQDFFLADMVKQQRTILHAYLAVDKLLPNTLIEVLENDSGKYVLVDKGIITGLKQITKPNNYLETCEIKRAARTLIDKTLRGQKMDTTTARITEKYMRKHPHNRIEKLMPVHL